MREIQAQSSAQPTLDATATLPWQDFVASIFRHRRLVLTVFVIGTLAVTAWAWTLPPTYKASAILMIRDNRTRLAVSPDAHTGSVMDTGSMDEVNSLVALLTSEVLVQEILAKDDPKAATANDEPELGLVDWVLNLPNELYRKMHNIPQPTALERRASTIADGIVVQPVQKSNVLDVSYYSGSPKFSAYFANRVVEEGISKYTRLSDTTRAQQFYRNQRELLATAVDDATVALNKFRERIGPEMVTLNRDQVRDRISSFEQNSAATRTEIAELNARMNASPESIWSDANTNDPSSGIFVNPSVPAIKARLMELQIHRGELISRYAPKSVMISDVDRQISEARRLLAQEQANTVEIYRKDTQARIDAAQARLEALQTQLSEYREKAAKLDTIAPEWERLQNELDTRRQAYQTYLQKEEEARFTNALDESQILNVTVAEPATPPHAPDSSPVFKLVLVGAGFSLFLGIGLAFMRDWMDPSVKTTQQAERLTGIPVLGEIPL